MRRRAMWAAPRPLRRVGFVERCCSPGLPLVWSALFVHDTAGGFLADGWGVTLVVVYVVVVAWHGSLQELSARGGVRRHPALAELREWALRGANTLADVSATLTGLFFLLRWFAAAWFAPLFLVALTAHAGSRWWWRGGCARCTGDRGTGAAGRRRRERCRHPTCTSPCTTTGSRRAATRDRERESKGEKKR